MNSHEDLLDRWKSRAESEIVKDGVFDEARWKSAPLRVLFILKDAYDSENPKEGWDLRQFAHEEGFNGVTLREMSHWVHALFHSDHKYPCNSSDQLREALLSTASINVKKTPGATYAVNSEIREHAVDFKDLLNEQIELIDPELVVCGSTWWAIKNVIEAPRTSDPTGLVYKTRSGRVFLDFWHPANRFPRLMNCATLTQLAYRAGIYSRVSS